MSFSFKKILGLVVPSLVVLILVTYSFFRYEAAADYSYLSPEQVREDFLQLTDKIESEVPNAFYYCYRSDYDLVKNTILSQIKDNMTSQEVYQLFYPLTQVLNDAHFSIYLSDEIVNKEVKSYFPLRVVIHQDKIYLKEDLTGLNQLKKGEEILAINNLPSEEVIKKLKGTKINQKNDLTFFEYRNQDIFHKKLYPLFGFKDEFQIKTKSNTYTLNGILIEEFNKNETSDYEFHILSNQTGHLKINSLDWKTNDQQERLQQFLEKNFKIMRNDSIEKLIVDIRGNLGGSSVLAKDILDYFTDTPYTLAVGVDYFAKGKTYSSELKELHKPSDNLYKFKGKIVLLSDVLTYSSAQMMQVGFKHYKMGITVGHQSSESYYITGQVNKTILKNSGIELYSPTANFKLPGYSENNIEYYTPDRVIYLTLEERLNDNDELLNKAIEILK